MNPLTVGGHVWSLIIDACQLQEAEVMSLTLVPRDEPGTATLTAQLWQNGSTVIKTFIVAGTGKGVGDLADG